MSDPLLDNPELCDEAKTLIRLMDALGMPRPPVSDPMAFQEGVCKRCGREDAVNESTGQCGSCDARDVITSKN